MTARNPNRCPVCRGPAEQFHLAPDLNTGLEHYNCGRCGRFSMEDVLCMRLDSGEQPTWWHRLSAWIREQQELGAKRPEIKHDLVALAAMLPTRSVSEQLDLLLQLVLKRTKEHLGTVIDVDLAGVAPLLWARDEAEVRFLVDALHAMGRITCHKALPDKVRKQVGVTIKGFERLDEIGRDAVRNRRIFVAMWFDPSMQEVREAIRGSLSGVGFEPVIIDQEPKSEHRIDARIFVEIRKCRGLVADATGLRPSVFFEAGFAAGLGKPVVWTVQQELVDRNGLPFDTRQLYHVPWRTAEDLAAKLPPVIEERFGLASNGGQ